MTAVVRCMASPNPIGIDWRSNVFAWRSRFGLLRANLEVVFAIDAQRPADSLDAVTSATDDSDAEDVRLARSGDGRAFERIVRRHQQEIARRLRRFSRDHGVIEDLVQETFVQAYFSLHRFRGDAPLVHWLYRIAVRSGYRYWKSKRSERTHVGIEDFDRATSSPKENDASELLDRVMSNLSPRDRLVLTLMYLDDHDVAETAALSGWSQTMVKVQAYRARGRLRKLVERDRAGERRGRD